ncbi:hypothetical protein PSAB6_190157 [Paraburkholderia sabiae]|nr:hypothetical protein PSAB6_190157 [Paraburkholderia sabiae]
MKITSYRRNPAGCRKYRPSAAFLPPSPSADANSRTNLRQVELYFFEYVH